MKEEFSTNARRWYDRDPVLSSAMKTLEESDDETQIKIDNPSQLPDVQRISSIEEPFVKATIMCPKDYIGPIMELAQAKRGIYEDMIYLDES